LSLSIISDFKIIVVQQQIQVTRCPNSVGLCTGEIFVSSGILLTARQSWIDSLFKILTEVMVLGEVNYDFLSD